MSKLILLTRPISMIHTHINNTTSFCDCLSNEIEIFNRRFKNGRKQITLRIKMIIASTIKFGVTKR